jgi:hypothetical protein
MAQMGPDSGGGARPSAKGNSRRRSDTNDLTDNADDRGTDRDRTTDPSRSSAHGAEPTVGIEEATASSAGRARPMAEAISSRAYELYLERGAADGHDLDDWLRAERELDNLTKPRSED